MAAAERDNRRRNSCRVTFSKESSKYIRLRWRFKLTTTK